MSVVNFIDQKTIFSNSNNPIYLSDEPNGELGFYYLRINCRFIVQIA